MHPTFIFISNYMPTKIWGRRDTCICMAESLHYKPETTTTLLIDYTTIQKKKMKGEKIPQNYEFKLLSLNLL